MLTHEDTTIILGTLSFGFQPLATHRQRNADCPTPTDTIDLDASKKKSLTNKNPSDSVLIDSAPVPRLHSVNSTPTVDHDTAQAGRSKTEAAPDSAHWQTIDPANDKYAGTMIGRYRIINHLGSGSFGLVFRCCDEDLKRDVAIKIPLRHRSNSTDRVDEFLHEAQSVARLKHPGIVTVWDANQTDDGRVFIVYEFIEGDSLQTRLQSRDFDSVDAVRWITDVAEALQHAHAQGIVHRDIKPANILLNTEGRACVADFGLATIDEGFFKDDAGSIVGTIAYMSPEQASGRSHWATPQTDIYALGVTLYQLLTGKLPFASKSVNEALDQIKHRDPAPPRTVNTSISPELEEICLKAMAKSPVDRYRTAGDMANELRTVVSVVPPVNRSWMWIAAGGCVAISLGTLLALFSWDTPKAEQTIRLTARQTVQEFAATHGLTQPHLTIHFKQQEETPTYEQLTTQKLSDGDKVQPHVLLKGDPKYIYVYWYDQTGEARRLYPENSQLDFQQPTNYWTGPDPGDENKFWELTGGEGLETLLLAVSEIPIDRGALEKFQEICPYDEGELMIDKVFHAGSSEIAAELKRGLGAIVTSPKHPLSFAFRHAVSGTFGEYHAMIIPHE